MQINVAEPDQTPRTVVSDLVLYCSPIANEIEARLIWVKYLIRFVFRNSRSQNSKIHVYYCMTTKVMKVDFQIVPYISNGQHQIWAYQ